MLLGKKHEFAVEFRFAKETGPMGYGKIWIQNQFYGSKEDLIYLNGYLGGLIKELINSRTIDSIDYLDSPAELMEYMKIQSEVDSRFIIQGSTFTDDFIGYHFYHSGKVYLVWKLRENDNVIFEDLKNYGYNIHVCWSELSIIESICKELEAKINRRDVRS